jgi:hypothetical protein
VNKHFFKDNADQLTWSLWAKCTQQGTRSRTSNECTLLQTCNTETAPCISQGTFLHHLKETCQL